MGTCDDAPGALPSSAGHSLHSRTRLLVGGDAARHRVLGAADVASGGRDASDGACSVHVRARPSGGARGRACAAVGVEAVGGKRHVRDGERGLARPTAGHLRCWSPDVDDLRSGARRDSANSSA